MAPDVLELDVGGTALLDRYEQRIAQEGPFLQTAGDCLYSFMQGGCILVPDTLR